MAKKKNRAASESEPGVDLKAEIHDHALFFDKLIELIPARFYILNEKKKPWFQGLSKEEKAAAKRESKENIKKARRERLDPEKSSQTTLDLLKQNLEKEKSVADDENQYKPMMSALEDNDRSVTYEELRLKLHRKIEELRAGRGGSDKANRSERNTKKKQIQQNKRKRDSGPEEHKSGKSTDKAEKNVEAAVKELAFSHVKIGDEEDQGRKKKKRKLSKSKELEKAIKLQEAMNDPEKGDRIVKKHSWQAATSRAAGVKVHDDPKLLKQSIHKEKKRHEKAVQKWKDRFESQQKLKLEKQQKRSENIAERIHQKKMRKIAKREKKLMRPGFEGRKEGFINEDKA